MNSFFEGAFGRYVLPAIILQSVLISVIFLLIATALARIGIIDLVAKGYAIMGYGLIGVYGIPLATIGLFRIIKPEWKKEFWAQDRALHV